MEGLEQEVSPNVLFRIKCHKLALNWFQPIFHYGIPFFPWYLNYINGLSEDWKTDRVAGLIVLFPEQNTCCFPKRTMNGLQEETKACCSLDWNPYCLHLGDQSLGESLTAELQQCVPPTHPTPPACPTLRLPRAQQWQFQLYAKSSNENKPPNLNLTPKDTIIAIYQSPIKNKRELVPVVLLVLGNLSCQGKLGRREGKGD